MRQFIFLGLLLQWVLLASCSSTYVTYHDQSPDADLSQYKTFDFYKIDVENRTRLEPREEGLELLKSDIREEMEKRGYVYDESNPDLRINLGIVMEEEVQTRETDIRDAPVYMGTRNYYWESEEVAVREWQKGTVIMDIVDAADGELLWEAAASGALTPKGSKMDKRIDEAVQKMFRKFPGQAGS